MSRPKTAGERNESIMVEKAKKAMEKTKDPVEKLRFVPQLIWRRINLQNLEDAEIIWLWAPPGGVNNFLLATPS